MTAKTHARYLVSSAWSHLRPKRPFLPREDWIRLGGGVVLAAVLGAFVHRIAPGGALMVNVGSFLGALLCLLPRHHSRTTSVIAGLILVDGGAAVGILLSDHRLLTFVVLVIGLFVAGMTRAVSVGAFMRLVFASVAVSAAGEMASPLALPGEAWPGLAALAIGQVTVAFCGCVGRPRRRFVEQRQMIAELYRQLGVLADGADSHVIRARVLARESVELIPLLEFAESRWIRVLLDAADEIAANLAAGPRSGDRAALDRIQAVLSGEDATAPPPDADLSPGVRLAVEALDARTRPVKSHHDLRNLHPRNTVDFYLRELRDTRGSTVRFAARITLTGLFCQLAGEFLIVDIGPGLPFHAFWTLLAGCLMAMPDYHGTTGKAIARTLGSILGAVLGTALSLIPALQHTAPFLVIAALFVLAYMAARTISQGALMLVVVAWLAFLLGGEPAAFTRTLDTIVGAVIAAVVFFLLPTWNVDRIGELFEQWCVRARFAFTAITGHLQTPGALEVRAEGRAFDDLVHAERRMVRAALVVPLEPRSDEAPWPLENLPLISDCLDRMAVSLLQLHRSRGTNGPTEDRDPDDTSRAGLLAASPELAEAFAEAFSALAAGRHVNVPEPGPGALHSLWRELHELDRLTVQDT